MAELLERIRSEIHDRLEISRAAVYEYDRLEAALTALGGPIDTPAAGARAAPKRRARRAAAAKRERAPRGANREAVLRVLGERPGVSASELAAASGVDRTVLYALLARLTERGEVLQETLPGGSNGYSLPREPSAFEAPPAQEAAPAPQAPSADEDPSPAEDPKE